LELAGTNVNHFLAPWPDVASLSQSQNGDRPAIAAAPRRRNDIGAPAPFKDVNVWRRCSRRLAKVLQVTEMEKSRLRQRKATSTASPLPVRERVLNAAFAAFMEKGYTGTSTLEIATRAKVSKRELYQICADKGGLLREAIAERAERMRLPLDLPPAKDREGLAATMRAFGIATLRGLCDPAVRAVFRLVISESVQTPEIARALGGSRAANSAALARTFSQARADGLIGAGDPTTMAVDFLALLIGDLMMQMLLRLAVPPAAAAIERRAGEATEKFLRLYP
jgi:AcrR family transcriptional regulator